MAVEVSLQPEIARHQCEEAEDRINAEWGCYEASIWGKRWKSEDSGQESDRCPVSRIESWTAEYLTAYNMVKSNLGMPEVGTWLDQSIIFLRAFQIIESAVNRHQEREMNKAQESHKSESRSWQAKRQR